MSHTVRLPGTSSEVKFTKNGPPHATADPAMIAYCKSRPHMFSVHEAKKAKPAKPAATSKPKAAAKKPTPRGRSGGKSGKSGKSKVVAGDDD